MKKILFAIFLTLTLILASLYVFQFSNNYHTNDNDGEHLRAASSYTPYDAHVMLWAKKSSHNQVAWTLSGGESGQLLVSKASTTRRPDWVLCTQGVVAGLVTRGHDVRIIATVYISDQAILPLFKKPRSDLRHSRSMYIPMSSIEFAFDKLLKREKLSREDVQVPQVDNVSFATIASFLTKDKNEKDALDFGILVDPYITNILTEHPNDYELGDGGLYRMHYCLVVRTADLVAKRDLYIELLKELVKIDCELSAFQTDDEFYKNVWGRYKDNKPELLPRMVTYKCAPAKLSLRVNELKEQLSQEISYLVEKYPGHLIMPTSVEALIDPSLLESLSPDRVMR